VGKSRKEAVRARLGNGVPHSQQGKDLNFSSLFSYTDWVEELDDSVHRKPVSPSRNVMTGAN
jgi:hypothetical protein